jgi:hypothetical protein
MFQTLKLTIDATSQFGESLILTNNSLYIAEGGWSTPKNVHAYSRSAGLWSKTSLIQPPGDFPLLDATDDFIVSSSSSSTFIYSKSASAWSTTATLSESGVAASISGSSVLVAKRDQAGYGLVFEQISSAWTQVAALVPSVTLTSPNKCEIGLSSDAKVAGLCGSGKNHLSSSLSFPHFDV